MKRREFLIDSALVGSALSWNSQAVLSGSAPRTSIAERLREGMIWSKERPRVPLRTGGQAAGIADVGNVDSASDHSSDLHAVFAKEFVLETPPTAATLNIFAHTRYRLYVNGAYVGRGPSRYQVERPEFDSWDVRAFLAKGRNVINVLAHRDAPTGRIMYHEPGMAALLEVRGERARVLHLPTDESWRAQPERSFASRAIAWSSIEESIDARQSPDWRDPAYDFSTWPPAVRLDAEQSPPLAPRTIPLLRETTLAWKTIPEFPRSLSGGDRLELDLERIILGYHRLEIEAEEGSAIEIEYRLPEGQRSGQNRYIARGGRQSYEGGDSFAFDSLSVAAISGNVRILSAEAVEVRYPFDLLGRFESSDSSLNRLWALAANSLRVMSEDAYVDCADRERVEWIDNTPPAFECTRVMMAGPKPGGGHYYSDPRLLKAMLQRIALTQRSDGQIKAHSCSERWDIHAIMEDRSCDWVIALRQYFDCTADLEFVRSLWPTVTRLMQWFLSQRTPRGLVQAREWEVWDNPLRYQVCEGAGLNALVYRALVDASCLGNACGFRAESHAHEKAARTLADAVNLNLWDERSGAYFGGLFGEGSRLAEQLNGKMFSGPIVDGRYRSTLQAAVFAAYSGIVPLERRDRVNAFIRAHMGEAEAIMTHHFLFKALYAQDDPVNDALVLELMRAKWRGMLDSPWQTSWEALEDHGGSKLHLYGIVPGYFLSAFVLGVRVEGPVKEGIICVDPRPGDLEYAGGVVVTEFGPVEIDWRRAANGAMRLRLDVPKKCHAKLRLPAWRESTTLEIDGRATTGRAERGKIGVMLPPGLHHVVQRDWRFR